MPYGVIPVLSDHEDMLTGVHCRRVRIQNFSLFESGLIALRPDGGFVLLPGLVSFFLDLCDDVYRGM